MPEEHRYAGRSIGVRWDAAVCRHAAECVRGLPEVFRPGERPWVHPDRADPEDVAAVIRRCPSGALRYTLGAAANG